MVSRNRALLVAVALIVFVFIASLLTALAASSPGVGWEKTYDVQGSDAGICTQQTSDGGYVIAGTADSGGSPKACLVKVDGNGDVTWKNSYAIGQNSRAYGIIQASDGGYVVTGSTLQGGRYLVLLMKINGDGSMLWNSTYGDSSRSVADSGGYSVRQAPDGGYIIAAEYPDDRYGHQGLFLIKTGSDGKKVWNSTLARKADVSRPSLEVTGDGGCIVASTLSDNGGAATYLTRFDGSGNMQWDKQIYSGYMRSGLDGAVRQTKDGGYIVAGESGGACLVKTDATGNVQWTKQYGDCVRANSAALAKDGGYVLACADKQGMPLIIKAGSTGEEEWRQAGSLNGEATSIQGTADGGYIAAGTSNGDLYLLKISPPAPTPTPTPTPATAPIKKSLFSGFGDLFGNKNTDYGQAVSTGHSLFSAPSFSLFTGSDTGSSPFANMTSFGSKNTGYGIGKTEFPAMSFNKIGWPFT
jgi:hypothetical protein